MSSNFLNIQKSKNFKQMKLTFSLIALFFVFNTTAQSDTLKLSMDVWPPFTNVEGEKSIASEIVIKALEEININTQIIVQDFDKVTEGINSGRYNGSPAFWKSDEREKNLFFSAPYLKNQLILVGRKGTKVDLNSFIELKGSSIGLVEGYAYTDSLTEVENLKITYGKNDQENLENLLSEKVDYMLVDALLIQYLLKYELNNVSSLLEFAKQPIIVNSLYLALRKDIPDAEKILTQFNEEIKTLMANGSYNDILELDWIRADIDGDGFIEIIHHGEDGGIVSPDMAYNISPSDAAKPIHYYINGTLYESWEDVPEQYKVQKSIKDLPEVPQNYGLTISF